MSGQFGGSEHRQRSERASIPGRASRSFPSIIPARPGHRSSTKAFPRVEDEPSEQRDPREPREPGGSAGAGAGAGGAARGRVRL